MCVCSAKCCGELQYSIISVDACRRLRNAATAVPPAFLSSPTTNRPQPPPHPASCSESLCPDCQHMVRDVLAPLFKNGVADLMRLRYGLQLGGWKGSSREAADCRASQAKPP